MFIFTLLILWLCQSADANSPVQPEAGNLYQINIHDTPFCIGNFDYGPINDTADLSRLFENEIRLRRIRSSPGRNIKRSSSNHVASNIAFAEKHLTSPLACVCQGFQSVLRI